MNPYKHSEISVIKRGGKINDYYPIHSFLDSTKELCSDHRHRIFHNLWGIRRIIIPIFGSTIMNSDGKTINVKDVCEQDHILPDFNNRFIPTLNDFINQIDELNTSEQELLNKFHKSLKLNPYERELLLSPLSMSGKLSSLLITHNSWFLNEILPKVFKRHQQISEYLISPQLLFSKLNYSEWMDNGRMDIPISLSKIRELT